MFLVTVSVAAIDSYLLATKVAGAISYILVQYNDVCHRYHQMPALKQLQRLAVVLPPDCSLVRSMTMPA